jgi:hypothetical protein
VGGNDDDKAEDDDDDDKGCNKGATTASTSLLTPGRGGLGSAAAATAAEAAVALALVALAGTVGAVASRRVDGVSDAEFLQALLATAARDVKVVASSCCNMVGPVIVVA